MQNKGIDLRTVVVTGGASGMGQAAVRRIAASGADVVVLDVVAPNEGARFVRCDLADRTSIDQAMDELPASIDALVNVAGVARAPEMAKVVAVNFLGLRYLTESLIPRIPPFGSVVVVASSAGHDWRNRAFDVEGLLDTPNFEAGWDWLLGHRDVWQDNPYKFSKQCAAAYTHRASGIGLPGRVRVNCVNPGAVETPLTPAFRDLLGEDVYDWGVAQIGRHAQPDDVGEVIAFLAGDQCRWLNGVEIPVDGGFLSGLYGGWIDPTGGPAPRPPTR